MQFVLIFCCSQNCVHPKGLARVFPQDLILQKNSTNHKRLWNEIVCLASNSLLILNTKVVVGHYAQSIPLPICSEIFRVGFFPLQSYMTTVFWRLSSSLKLSWDLDNLKRPKVSIFARFCSIEAGFLFKYWVLYLELSDVFSIHRNFFGGTCRRPTPPFVIIFKDWIQSE